MGNLFGSFWNFFNPSGNRAIGNHNSDGNEVGRNNRHKRGADYSDREHQGSYSLGNDVPQSTRK